MRSSAITATDSKIAVQLRTLLQLTQTEAQIAQARQAQARTDAVRRELAQNAGNAEDRARAIAEALRALGGVPDVLTPALGRVSALAKTVTEQAEPLAGALFEDLSLEHQLLDRARYTKVLAEAADNTAVRRLAERLVAAHTATVEWLTTVLAEEALGGPTALRPTPLQAVAGGATRVVNFPVRWYAEQVNKTADRLQQAASQTKGRFGDVAGKAGKLREAAVETVTAGRNAALQQAEKVARRDGAGDTAKAVHETRVETGSLTAAELPIKNYDNLSSTDALKAVKALTSPADLRAVIGYEETHKNRGSLVSAAQTTLAGIAKDAVGV